MRECCCILFAAELLVLLTLGGADKGGAPAPGAPLSASEAEGAGLIALPFGGGLVQSSDFFLRPGQAKRDLTAAGTGAAGEVGVGAGVSAGDALRERTGDGLADWVLSA